MQRPTWRQYWHDTEQCDVSNTEALRLSQDVARVNGISNPDRIYPGQRLNLSVLTQAQQAAPNLTTQQALQSKRVQASTNFPVLPGQNAILQKTLDRAVEKGYVPAEEKQQVYQKILGMARQYQFAPDDFARLTLMESDGMNPKANNGHCYGVIQFCDGPNRGAASVGYAGNPKGILKLGVMDQLDLVKKYFDETGLKKMAPATLEDLYLTVLRPASRAERDPSANLQIPGSQAAALYPGNDRNLPITRKSLLAGLQQNALGKLALEGSRGAPPMRVASLSGSAGAGAIQPRLADFVGRVYGDDTRTGKSDYDLSARDIFLTPVGWQRFAVPEGGLWQSIAGMSFFSGICTDLSALV